MRVVQITPGSGDTFYCENCLRDKALVLALRAMGHDCLMVPLYLPPLGEPVDTGDTAPMFFGGINVYLQEKLSLFRRTPRWIDRAFDSLGLLRLAGRVAGMTSARDQGQATLSMLRGQDGRQKKELDRLTAYLASSLRPDVVCLSNALLAGLARQIKQVLGVPVVCLLQDEEEFLDALEPKDRDAAWAELAARAADVDVFVAASEYHRRVMIQRAALPPAAVRVVYAGLDPADYAPAERPPSPPVIGFLSRLCRAKGLHTLVEAFLELRRDGALRELKLRASGGSTSADRAYLKAIQARVKAAGAADSVAFLPNLMGDDKVRFLQSLTVLSVPEVRGEAAGIYMLEAQACGVPLVQPRTGAGPEILQATGGGILYEPNTPEALAASLRSLLLDKTALAQAGLRGRQGIETQFNSRRAAADMLTVFRQAIART